MIHKSIALVALSFAFFTSAAAQDASTSSLKKSAFSFLSDYGIPIAAESSLEALRKGLEPVKNVALQGICGTGPMYYVCWYAGNVIDLQNYNIRSGLSQHLQDKVSSFSQDTYNSLFALPKSQGAIKASRAMESLRSATTRSQSMESVKARITLGQLKPILDSLFAHASSGLNRGELETSTQNAARVVAYATLLIATYFPEYDGNEPEISGPAKALTIQIQTPDFRGLVESELAKQLSDVSLSEPALMKRVNIILCAWMPTDSAHHSLCKASGETNDTKPTDTFDQALHSITWAGLIAPAVLFNINPRDSDTTSLILRTTLNSVSQNLAVAATRVDAMDFFANVRRSVQRLAVPEEKRVLQEAESYKVLRDRQFKVSLAWSELGLRMRANLLRYLALVVPTFAETSKQISLGRTKEAAATIASTLSYIRQYDPEYGADDIHLKMAAHAVLGETPKPLREELKLQLAQLDPAILTTPSVASYYDTLLGGLFEPHAPTVTLPQTFSSVPWSSVGLSLVADLSNVALKTTLAATIAGFSPKAKTLVNEVYSKFGEVVLRGVGEPAKEDIQQALASAHRTATEEQLVAGSVEMNGRTGGDAQMARAIYERIEPTIFHLFDGARDAYQAGDKDSAARLIAYSITFLLFIYPEAPASDVLISALAKSRFAQFVTPNDLDFARLVAKHLAYYDQGAEPLLACQFDERLVAFGLLTDKSISDGCLATKSEQDSWLVLAQETGKTMGYYAGMGSAVLLPALAAIYTPKQIEIQGAHRSVNFLATCVLRAAVGLGVTSVFNGITTGLTSSAKSTAQRWSQYFRITHRVDESENWGRSQSYFGRRQWALPQFLSPAAQEGRKDLLLVAQNVAQNLRNAKAARLQRNEAFAASQLDSLHYLLGQYYSEGAEHYNQMLADMKYAFLGEVQTSGKQSPMDKSDPRDEL